MFSSKETKLLVQHNHGDVTVKFEKRNWNQNQVFLPMEEAHYAVHTPIEGLPYISM